MFVGPVGLEPGESDILAGGEGTTRKECGMYGDGTKILVGDAISSKGHRKTIIDEMRSKGENADNVFLITDHDIDLKTPFL
jgi:hypothetical protein